MDSQLTNSKHQTPIGHPVHLANLAGTCQWPTFTNMTVPASMTAQSGHHQRPFINAPVATIMALKLRYQMQIKNRLKELEEARRQHRSLPAAP